MKKRVIIILTLLTFGMFSATAQDVFGKWKTIDDETGETKSIVEIYVEGAEIYGKVIDILNPERKNSLCVKCKGVKKNQPILGMVIIEELTKNDAVYKGGTILDPENGKVYKCKIWLDEADSNKLYVRGYVGFFFRTQHWLRVTEN